MRVAITGATGNVGSRVVAQLLELDDLDSIIGVVRRPASGWDPRVRWEPCDIGQPGAESQLRHAFTGVDAVIHLAWQIQPARDRERMRRTNIDGSKRVFGAAFDSGVGAIVYLSSVGTYSAGPKDRAVDESWPTDGIPSSSYAQDKATVERMLDDLEQSPNGPRVVRFRPGLIFQSAAASEISRYFLGPFVPLSALHRRLIPIVPSFDRLVFQVVHTDDVAAAVVRAVTDADARGAYNLAAEPVLDPPTLGRTLGARPVPTPLTLLRLLTDVSYRARLQPTDPGWVDMVAAVPVMSTERARSELGWSPQHSSTDALIELVDGMRQGIGGPSPVLGPNGSALSRARTAVRVLARGGPGAQDP